MQAQKIFLKITLNAKEKCVAVKRLKLHVHKQKYDINKPT
jgi:hypothetical protein